MWKPRISWDFQKLLDCLYIFCVSRSLQNTILLFHCSIPVYTSQFHLQVPTASCSFYDPGNSVLFSFVVVLTAVNANDLQVLQNRFQLCLSYRLRRLFSGDFLHMYLEVYLLCLVLPMQDILKRHVLTFLSFPEETSVYGYSM